WTLKKTPAKTAGSGATKSASLTRNTNSGWVRAAQKAHLLRQMGSGGRWECRRGSGFPPLPISRRLPRNMARRKRMVDAGFVYGSSFHGNLALDYPRVAKSVVEKPLCPCGSNDVRVEVYDFGTCSQTGYVDADERSFCRNCGEEVN